MAGAGVFGAGPGAVSGPPPWAVAEVARRLAGIAGEMDALRLQLGHVALLDWKSPAAAAFRDELAERNTSLAATVQAIEKAAGEVGAYGSALSANAGAGNCDGPDVRQAPGAGGFGNGFGGGPASGFGSWPGQGFGGVAAGH